MKKGLTFCVHMLDKCDLVGWLWGVKRLPTPNYNPCFFKEKKRERNPQIIILF